MKNLSKAIFLLSFFLIGLYSQPSLAKKTYNQSGCYEVTDNRISTCRSSLIAEIKYQKIVRNEALKPVIEALRRVRFETIMSGDEDLKAETEALIAETEALIAD